MPIIIFNFDRLLEWVSRASDPWINSPQVSGTENETQAIAPYPSGFDPGVDTGTVTTISLPAEQTA